MYAAGQWIVNLNYWGCNQYITQRALGADLTYSANRFAFCSTSQIDYASDRNASGHCRLRIDETGSSSVHGTSKWIMHILPCWDFLPAGLKGLSIAALTAAIVASLAGKINSISTILYTGYL